MSDSQDMELLICHLILILILIKAHKTISISNTEKIQSNSFVTKMFNLYCKYPQRHLVVLSAFIFKSDLLYIQHFALIQL